MEINEQTKKNESDGILAARIGEGMSFSCKMNMIKKSMYAQSKTIAKSHTKKKR